MTPGNRDRFGRFAPEPHQRSSVTKPFGSLTDEYGLSLDDLEHWKNHFAVEESEIQHDYAISRVLQVLEPESDSFVFYGGTALSRTLLEGLRLSEDIDLLCVGPRRNAARRVDMALHSGLRHWFGQVRADPALTDVRKSTDACVYRFGDVELKIQLINGATYTPWPRQRTPIEQRYSGVPPIELTTYTPAGFAAAKTNAWSDRNTSRDLYDLWGLARENLIDREAALVFRRHGPTNGYPHSWIFPPKPPSIATWEDDLRPLCVPQVDPDEAYETVVSAWETAIQSV